MQRNIIKLCQIMAELNEYQEKWSCCPDCLKPTQKLFGVNSFPNILLQFLY